MEKYDLVIIDSGVNTQEDKKITGLSVIQNNILLGDIKDSIGHGTIIYNIFLKHLALSSILIIKLFDDQHMVTEDDLICALEYIKRNIHCKVINVSFGFKICYNVAKLKDLCSDIVKSGSVIVAAFDNDGCYSYPACLDDVIGVDNNSKIKNIFDFEYVEGSPINIRGKGGIQRLTLDNKSTVIVSGSSIACAYISVFILKHYNEDKTSLSSIKKCLKEHACCVYKSTNKTIVHSSKNLFNLENVSIFPFSKESHAFVRFNNMLSFHIKHYYDIRYSGHVGMRINKLNKEIDSSIQIEDIDKSDFSDVDTLVIGHMDELNNLLQKDYRKIIIQRAIAKGVNIYSFDPLVDYEEMLLNSNVSFYSPSINEIEVPQNTFNKLYKVNKPVVGIFGTSSCQGKFSVQLTLMQIFKKNNYKVGSIGTEPQSLLFGMDYVYPMGYNSTVYINPWQSITYLNHIVNRLCDEVEIVFAASQAGSVPHDFNNLSDFPVKQNVFLMGIQPDAIILCINMYDDIMYIKNSIQFLQGLSNSKVIALVVFPMTVAKDWRSLLNVKIPVESIEFQKKSVVLNELFDIPIYLLGEKSDMDNLYHCIIDYF